MKRQVTDWEKCLQNRYLTKDLYSVTGGKLIHFFKWEESPERYFTKEDIWMAKKQMKMLNIINCQGM